MPQERNIRFEGPGPYNLPAAQSVRASRVDNTIVLTFQLLVEPDRIGSVSVAVLDSQAPSLVDQISQAFSESK